MNWTLFVLTEWWLCDLIYDVIHTQHIHAPVLATFWTGCPLSRRKNSLSFPCFSRAIIILFQRSSQQEVYVIMAFVYQGSFHVNYYSCILHRLLLLIWLTTACRPILLKSTVFVATYGLLDTGCIQSTKSVFPEVAENSTSFPCSEKSLRFQVFQFCGHPVELLAVDLIDFKWLTDWFAFNALRAFDAVGWAAGRASGL